MCDNLDGEFAPFCDPLDGIQVSIGDIIEVTWDPAFFKLPGTTVRLGVDVASPDNDPPENDPTAGAYEGWWHESVNASIGSYVWTVEPSTFGSDRVLDATLSLGVDEPGSLGSKIPGPRFQYRSVPSGSNTPITPSTTSGPDTQIMPSTTSSPETSGSSAAAGAGYAPLGIHPAAVAVPVVAAVAVFVLVGWYSWRKQRRAQAKAANWEDDYKTAPSAAPSVSSVPGVVNVFRQEVQRQDDLKN